MEKLKQNDLKITLCITLKSSAAKKLRLRIWGYLLGKYLYLLACNRLTLRHKKCSISQEDDDFFRIRKQSVKRGIWHTGVRRRCQRGGAFPLAALAAPLLGNLSGIILKKNTGGGRRKRRARRPYG